MVATTFGAEPCLRIKMKHRKASIVMTLPMVAPF
jgi:hypothetical protein